MPERSTIRYTYEDYLGIPEDTSRRHEIVDGALFVTPAPRPRHAEVVASICRVLGNLVVAHDLGKLYAGPVTVRLHDEGVVEPDLVFVRADRLELVEPDGAVHGPPDLVVEVLSPSNRDYDRNAKRKQYMDSGVAELWIADADEGTVEVWRAETEGAEVLRETLVWYVSGGRFEISLGEMFRGL